MNRELFGMGLLGENRGQLVFDRVFVVATCVLSVLVCVLFLGAALAYVRIAPPLLDGLYPTIGELSMKEAGHLEKAGRYSEAFEAYLGSLEGRYQGEKNRAFTLYRLGMLQREKGLGEGQPDYLKEVFGDRDCPAEVYEVLARELMGRNAPERSGELDALFAHWEGAVSMGEDRAMYYFYRGGYAQMQGERDMAQMYWARGEGYFSGSPCAYALGESLFGEGAFSLAEHYNNLYLLEGANPDYLASAQGLALRMSLRTEAGSISGGG